MHGTDRGGFLALPQPRLGDHSLLHHALERDVGEAVAQKAAIQREQPVALERPYERDTLGMRVECILKTHMDRRIGGPRGVLGGIERGVPLHQRPKIFPMNPPWLASPAPPS